MGAKKKGDNPRSWGQSAAKMIAIPNLIEIKRDSGELHEAYTLAIQEVVGVLKRERAITDVTRIAANTISNYSRIKSTEIHDKALEIMLARKDFKPIGT